MTGHDETEYPGIYDQALADSMRPILTLGGTKGKGNRIAQTGRSKGASVLRRIEAIGHLPRIQITNIGDWSTAPVSIDPERGTITLSMAVAGVPFKPRHAYKGLCKMGLALLPEKDLADYAQLIEWLQTIDDHLDFPHLEVGLSFGSIGNAPPFASGILLRRVKEGDTLPYTIFLFSAGSMCVQIDLMSDHREDHYGPIIKPALGIEWNAVIGNADMSDQISIAYGLPFSQNWNSPLSTPQPIDHMRMDFEPSTLKGHFSPVFRDCLPQAQ